MNKKLKFIIAGVAIVAGLASAVSCKDLSKDVEDLSNKEISDLLGLSLSTVENHKYLALKQLREGMKKN